MVSNLIVLATYGVTGGFTYRYEGHGKYIEGNNRSRRNCYELLTPQLGGWIRQKIIGERVAKYSHRGKDMRELANMTRERENREVKGEHSCRKMLTIKTNVCTNQNAWPVLGCSI